MSERMIKYHESLSQEIMALKDRVRDLLHPTEHWGEDGRHKEEILRTVFARHLPENVIPATGFVRTSQSTTNQQDLMFVDRTRPFLFKSDTFVITHPQSVMALIEVKTRVTNGDLDTVTTKLSQNVGLINEDRIRENKKLPAPWDYISPNAWAGLFSFEASTAEIHKILESLDLATQGDLRKVIHCACVGPNLFIRFWDRIRDPVSEEYFTGWRAYKLQNLAYSYFISNMIWRDSEDTNESNDWFALASKETHLIAERKITWPSK